jgi:putative MATE family efflux protein
MTIPAEIPPIGSPAASVAPVPPDADPLVSTPPPPAGRPNIPGKFTSGSILRHILVMTGASAVGLMAIFVGELANILFLSRLADVEVVAAVGYGSSVLFFATSVGIGLAIAATAVVSPALGEGALVRARRLTVSAHLLTAIVAAVFALLLWLLVPPILTTLGATGRTHTLAVQYLRLILPSLPALALGMTSGAILRSVGDARRSMFVTLSGAVVNVLLDPLFIFTFGLGMVGAAIATDIGRLVMAAVGIHAVTRVHNLMGRPKLRPMLSDAKLLAVVAIPAVLANVATPVGNAFVVRAVAEFGDAAVAGMAIISRVNPVAFGAIFALSGAVGPIIGQNRGARLPDRMRATVTNSLVVTAAFTLFAWVALVLLQEPLVRGFNATGETAALIRLFCRWVAPLFVFLGWLFVANACFNTLGRPQYSTAFNWGRATLGTVPFVSAGAYWWGAAGALVGQMVGGIAFGLLAVWVCYKVIGEASAAMQAKSS